MDRIPPQPTVMVTGRAGRQRRAVAMELFAERSVDSDGAVVVTTDASPDALLDEVSDGPGGLAPEGLAVVDARGEDANGGDPGVGWWRRVGPAVEPAALEEAVSAGLDWLADAGVDRRHFLHDTLAAEAGLVDEDGTYDRAYTVAMTVGALDGLALFTLDSDGLGENGVERLGHLFDVQVELRADREPPELRWRGLLGASDGWVALTEADLGVGGFR